MLDVQHPAHDPAVHQVGGRRAMGVPAGIRRSDHFTLRPCGPTIGAEVTGIDLDRPPTDGAVRDLKRAFLDWKVLFFRDQALSPQRHVHLARYWGQPVVYPLPAKGDLPEIVQVAHGPDAPGSENVWHSDVTYQQTPALGSILKAVELPPLGGDTLWADMAAAYDGLTAATKARIDGLVAVHDFLARYEGTAATAAAKRSRDMFPGPPAGQVAAGAVDRVEDPPPAGAAGPLAGLLPQHAVVRPGRGEHVPQRLLDRQVDRGDRRAVRLAAGPHSPAVPGQRDAAGDAGHPVRKPYVRAAAGGRRPGRRPPGLAAGRDPGHPAAPLTCTSPACPPAARRGIRSGSRRPATARGSAAAAARRCRGVRGRR